MRIETIGSSTVLCEFAGLVDIHTGLRELAAREVWAFLSWMEVLAWLVLAEREVFAFDFALVEELGGQRRTSGLLLGLRLTLFEKLRVGFDSFDGVRDLDGVCEALDLTCLLLTSGFCFRVEWCFNRLLYCLFFLLLSLCFYSFLLLLSFSLSFLLLFFFFLCLFLRTLSKLAKVCHNCIHYSLIIDSLV